MSARVRMCDLIVLIDYCLAIVVRRVRKMVTEATPIIAGLPGWELLPAGGARWQLPEDYDIGGRFLDPAASSPVMNTAALRPLISPFLLPFLSFFHPSFG